MPRARLFQCDESRLVGNPLRPIGHIPLTPIVKVFYQEDSPSPDGRWQGEGSSVRAFIHPNPLIA